MPFCPKCRYEYQSHVTVCPDCNEPLVSHLFDDKHATQSQSEKPFEKWVPIVLLESRQYAEMVSEGLRAKNIPAVVYSTAGHSGFYGHMADEILKPKGHGHFILVPTEFIEDADKEGEVMLGETWRNSRIKRHFG
jgi:hypothetical protein